ncbi:RNA polymerase sigma factor [Mesoterricola silvestris]|uniref:RNA polymerase sigma factor n=1 Tax=Mesoterricola silvestris TaxID=2927979 RepID=A0AA48GPK3_9BACT|nr:sigma-70 family RNA polymerase sigma factor [Mesoterricola silvestris]BDU73360.1 RNA polymerase subunit sigma-24 [Mesoterricola silvestris]
MQQAALDSPYHGPEVQEWVIAAQGGDQAAFGKLVERFQRDVYGKAFSILKNHLDADDVVQETFLRVFRALPGFRFESSFRTWLITITTRQALNFLGRTRSSHESLDPTPDGQEHLALRVEDNQMSTLLDQESRRLLREALPRLPKRQRQALLLKIENDWKYDQIASEMNISVGSVKAHVFHAIQNLSQLIKGGRP